MKNGKLIALFAIALTAAAQQTGEASKRAAKKPAAKPAAVEPHLRFKLNGATRAMLDGISPHSMKAHVRFLASDALAGRATPSPGLDAAAEYIASQFFRMGLEPVAGDSYFQNVEMVSREYEEQRISISGGGRTWELTPRQAAPLGFLSANLSAVPVYKLTGAGVKDAKVEDLAGKVVLLTDVAANQVNSVFGLATKAKPAMILVADPALRRIMGGAGPMGRLSFAGDPAPRQLPAPFFTLNQKELADAMKELPPGATPYTLSAKLTPAEGKVVLRNVAGIVRGSDPVLKDEVVIVSAHYDHVGSRPDAEGDGIYNGANDDASGTASVMELAQAFVKLEKKPKRSILFIALFGEESGMLGSRAYAKTPLAPLAKTVANVNLEHIGRTDSSEGPRLNYGSFTGFDFSDMPQYFVSAGKALGVAIEKDEKRSDAFFARSDNQAFANVGIPAHTICVAFEFPDYHQPGDHWEKIDYDNMARVNRALAGGLLLMANSPQRPKWNEKNDKAKRYVEAAKKLTPTGN